MCLNINWSVVSVARHAVYSVIEPCSVCVWCVFSLSQLQECLAQLITENLEVTRWLFKLDDEFGGKGIAYLDMAKLSCYTWALKEAARCENSAVITELVCDVCEYVM